jgi:hypothetical protein
VATLKKQIEARAATALGPGERVEASAVMSEESTFAEPCQHPKGFEFVLVSGQLAVDGGETTGLRVGSVLNRAE